MTDKEQIMIDGVDVSKCKQHRKCILPDNIGCKIDDMLCCDKPNCEYKQLQRKEQECEELKKEIAFGNNGTLSDKIRVEVFKELNNENNQLKAENDELKKKCNIYTCGICGNKEDCNKLYKTLTEIKEIAEYCYDEVDKENDGFWLILQKISECEVNND